MEEYLEFNGQKYNKADLAIAEKLLRGFIDRKRKEEMMLAVLADTPIADDKVKLYRKVYHSVCTLQGYLMCMEEFKDSFTEDEIEKIDIEIWEWEKQMCRKYHLDRDTPVV